LHFWVFGKKNQEDLKEHVEELFSLGRLDEDDWVRALSELLSISTKEEKEGSNLFDLLSEKNESFNQIRQGLKQKLSDTRELQFVSLEYPFLSSALFPILPLAAVSNSHFKLKEKDNNSSILHKDTPTPKKKLAVPFQFEEPIENDKMDTEQRMNSSFSTNTKISKHVSSPTLSSNTPDRSLGLGDRKGFQKRKKMQVIDIQEVKELSYQESVKKTKRVANVEAEADREKKKKEKYEAAEQRKLDRESKKKKKEEEIAQKKIQQEQKKQKKKLLPKRK